MMLGSFYQNLEQKYGLPAGYLGKTRAVESANGTNLANPNSSARGDFQFINSTAKAMGLSNPMDPYASADAAARLAAQNKAAIVKATGQEPTGADLYAAHQQGSGGYLSLARGQSVGADAARLNGGSGMSPSGFLSSIRGKFDKAQPDNLGEGFVPPAGANAGQGPTVAAGASGVLQGPPDAMGPTAPNAAQSAEMAKANKYTGGFLGLAGVGDQLAPGMGKDVGDKLADIASQPGGGALGGLGTAISKFASAQATPAQQPGITLHADNSVHTGDPSYMAYLDPRRRRAMAMGG